MIDTIIGMKISEVKELRDCDTYCNGSDSNCTTCPLDGECENEYKKYEDKDYMSFYNWKINRIISYNRSRKIEKLLS